jgi:hypothetical protein
MKITALEEYANFATLNTEKLFSNLKSHELSRKGHSNHDASLTGKAFVTSTRVGDHVANPTNTTDSSALEFGLSYLAAASDEQYESIPDDEITLMVRKFCPCTGSERRGGDHRGTALSAATPPTSSPITPSGRSLTPPTSTTTTTGTTLATRARARRSTTLGTRRGRSRSSRRLCLVRVLPSATSTSPATTPPAHRRMRSPSASQVTSPAFASWASLCDTSLTPTLTPM